MKTIVLDDDPTGTQSSSGVPVLLDCSEARLRRVLTESDSIYVLTNSRAIPEDEAVALVTRVRAQVQAAGAALGEEVQFVLRGDSTLRGHVFAEADAFLDADSVLLFVPAFPDGGRTTRGGIHYVRIGGTDIPAADTEYAGDPVFPFTSSRLTDYVAEKSSRPAIAVPLDAVRSVDDMTRVLTDAEAGSVVVPDTVTNEDVRVIAEAVGRARRAGRSIVVRCASPLAAALAETESDGLLPSPLLSEPVPTLLICGSHTEGATRQLARVEALHGPPIVLNTTDALTAAPDAGRTAGTAAVDRLRDRGLAVVTTERVRSSGHNTLAHGEKVMEALTSAVREALPAVGVVISKGGITSADVARVGLGATEATVLGQVLPGVSVWSVPVADGRTLLYIVVPGNVGDPDTLVDVLDALSVASPAAVPGNGTVH